MNPTVLARRLGISPGGLTRRLERLEKEGWLVRERDLEERRRIAVTLTQQGEQRLKASLSERMRAARDRMADLDAPERSQLKALLVKLSEALA